MKRSPLTRKPRKPKVKPSTWKNKCDKIAQRLCVSGGSCVAEGYRLGCAGRLEWCHLKSRRFAVIRHDPKNSVCMCSAHHRFFTDHPDLWRDFIEDLYPGRWDYLNERLRETVKVDYELLHVGLTETLKLRGVA